ncbi:phage holin [Oceanobacillus kimchii]|uniref:phage holin n=1 Tax=Oceanobacillus kimchii TaxID=746691 RepID=UPI003C73231E
MKINWKVRFQKKSFWVAIFALIGLVVTDVGLLDIGTYEKYVDAVLYVLITGGVITDLTTKGLGDSKRALNYSNPRDDNKYL